ncbi:hypothetical protein KXP93_002538 [Staphylococcus pseudintermedius]|nr:hypothetical protein [Staphylococcus pseudintermedius]EHT3692556.1 hypothetical protein [Staphylococcus pseudintermedius]ELK4157962.1 hypothetical protein [Staphylococcus pseudintermedius]
MAKNLLNELIYVDFKEVSSIQLKQGDTSPILIKLINNAGVKSYKSLKEYAAESSSQRATVYLSTSKNTVVFKQSFEVKNGAVALTINQVLPVGTYFLEILYDGKVYPSANSLSVRINPSADIAQEDIISLETIEAIESNILSKVLPQVQEQIDALLSNQVQKYLAENGHTLRGERGEKGEPFKFEDFTSEQLKQLSPIADTGWLPVSLQNGFFNENESTSKLSYRIIRDESIGIINISGRIKTPNTLTRGLKYIASIPIKNDKVTALTAYASNYSGVSQTPTFSMFYENKTLTINTVTEIPANTVFDINGTTIVNLT